MTSLQEYVAREYPNHEIDVWEPTSPTELELAPHTVVSRVVGTRDGLDLLEVYRRSAPTARVAAVAVRPSHPTLVPSEDEDRGGPVDVPGSRIATSVAVGALVVGAVFGALMLFLDGSGMAALIVAGFAALIGAAVGAIVGGGRFAGERAESQPQAPGRTITVVAAFCDDDATAASLAEAVGPVTDYDVRIVNEAGAWRSPGASAGG